MSSEAAEPGEGFLGEFVLLFFTFGIIDFSSYR